MAGAATVVRSLSLDSLTTGVLTIAIFIGLIKAVRDAQGAHSRGALREDELPLNEPNAFTFAVGYSGRLRPGQEVQHAVEVLPSQAAIRQVGEELLRTINANNRAGLFD